MPTGYTAKLYEGEAQSFEEFVLSCARAMGVAITMRDDPPDKPIPDEFKPSDYHSNALADARKKLAELDALTLDQAAVRARDEFKKAEAARTEVERSKAAMKIRYEAMLAQVRGWEPPTEEHVGFKKFMTDQLEESIRFDCTDYDWPLPEIDPWKWLANAKGQAARDIAYHAKELEAEYERATGRTAWIRALRQSLEGQGGGRDR